MNAVKNPNRKNYETHALECVCVYVCKDTDVMNFVESDIVRNSISLVGVVVCMLFDRILLRIPLNHHSHRR